VINSASMSNFLTELVSSVGTTTVTPLRVVAVDGQFVSQRGMQATSQFWLATAQRVDLLWTAPPDADAFAVWWLRARANRSSGNSSGDFCHDRSSCSNSDTLAPISLRRFRFRFHHHPLPRRG